jgi:hypothetical protein
LPEGRARAGSTFFDSRGIPNRAEECDSFFVIAREVFHGPGLQPGFA